MVGSNGAFGLLIGAAVGTLFLVPAHVSAQDSCGDFRAGGPRDLLVLAVLKGCAERGSIAAQSYLGLMYANGEGVPEDDAEAVRWFRLAAEQGSSLSQLNLGVMYANGEGVPEDDVLAYMWLNLSAAQGNETARGNKDIIEQSMTREQIAEAQRLSREWIQTHPQDGGN